MTVRSGQSVTQNAMRMAVSMKCTTSDRDGNKSLLLSMCGVRYVKTSSKQLAIDSSLTRP